MKRLKHFFKILMTLIASTLLVVVMALAVIWMFPGILLRDETLPWLTSLIRTQGIYLYWGEKSHLSAESLSVLTKRIKLSSDRLCFSLVSPEGGGCFAQPAWQVEFRVLPFRITRIGPTQMLDGKIVLSESNHLPQQPGEPNKQESTRSPLNFSLPSFLRNVIVDSTRIQVKSFRYRPLRGDATVATLDLTGTAVGENADWNLSGKLDSRALSLKGKTRKVLGKGTDFELAGKFIDPQFQTKFEADGQTRKENLHVEFATSFADLKGTLDLIYGVKETSDLRFVLTMRDFQKFVSETRERRWAVPSPFNNLGGNAQILLTSQGDFTTTKGTFPFQVETSLVSASQRLHSVATGDFTIDSIEKMHLNAKLDLSDVQLVLPPLHLEKLPRLFPDPQIHTKPPRAIAADEKSSFTYHVQIETQPGHPLHLISNLAKSRIPIELSFTVISDEKPTGVLKVMSFPVELFKRNARVDHFSFIFAKNLEFPDVDGKFLVKTVDYEVEVLVLGSSEKPRILVQSNPPLSEEDAISVLMFGRTNSELSTNQGDSVANMRAAATNRALSLASMYLLASTPIESVLYDPVTKTFSAKVRIADGTSIDVGSNLTGVQELGLRKRIAPNWYIHTFLVDPFEATDRRSATAFLEWSQRY